MAARPGVARAGGADQARQTQPARQQRQRGGDGSGGGGDQDLVQHEIAAEVASARPIVGEAGVAHRLKPQAGDTDKIDVIGQLIDRGARQRAADQHRIVDKGGEDHARDAGDCRAFQHGPSGGHVAAVLQPVGERAAIIGGGRQAEPAQNVVPVYLHQLDGEGRGAQIRRGFPHRGLRVGP